MVYTLYFLMWRISCISWCGVQYIVSPDVAYILFFSHTYLSWYGVHPVFPYVTYFLYFPMWRAINSIFWYGVHPVFPDVTYFLYFLMWRTIYCFSWYGVYIVLSISWYGVYPVFPDEAYFLYFLMWRTINSISWYGVHPVFPDVTYFLYFLMWRTIYCISWCGVYTVLSISWYGAHPVFPDVAYFLYFLMWRTIHWVYWYMTDVLFFRHKWYFLVWRTSVFFLCGLFLVFPDVVYIALCLLIWSIYCSSDINDVSWYVAQPRFPHVAGFLHFLFWCSLHCRSWSGIYIVLQIYITYHVWRTSFITWCGVLFVFPDVTYNILYLLMWRIYLSSDIDSISW